MAISADILKDLKQPDISAIDGLLDAAIEEDGRKIVVLDDDPTGVQTVHDLYVYTGWDPESVLDGFRSGDKLFFILTNSRGFTEEETVKAHKDIAAAVMEASRGTGRDYILISRSDSTLRGHYPLETEVLKAAIEAGSDKRFDGEILCPFFKEGGRFTIDNVHYVKYGDELVPANETEFAADKTFGYSAATMPGYIEEKTGGKYKAADVTCISVEDLRNVNIAGITSQLMAVKDFGKVIVNAADYCDVKVFCIALYNAMKAGKTFMLRTAAAIVKEICGNPDRPLLSGSEMVQAG